MKQLTQNLRTGKMAIVEVPFPAVIYGYVVVQTHFSLISSGTEGSKVKTARSSLLAKARKKPDQVKQVFESLKNEGVHSTYSKVMNKLDAPSPLGYSCAGEVIEVGEGVDDFVVGDLVSCGGAGAYHGEVVAIPKNLCAKVAKNIKLEHAAYVTVSSIALQGIRQADLRIGESCAVIGLGLIGQLTIQMLKVAGIKTYAIDIDMNMVDLANQSGADAVFDRKDPALETTIRELSGGHGVDGVIITAGTSSLDPVELAGILCRKKGKTVVVGAVPTGFSRPNYYKKELELKMSCSYGPGRYESNYEEKGLDYPIGFVRWTENRNMQAVLDMIHDNKLNLDLLTSHVFDFEDASNAYQMILDKQEPFVGILLKYNVNDTLKQSVEFAHIKHNYGEDKPGIGFIGAGSFAQKYLLPNVQKIGNLISIATATGANASHIAEKFGFRSAHGNAEEVLENIEINTVFIATRHNLHAQYVLKSLKQGKNIFVEKPLCMKEDELNEIKKEYEQRSVHLMVGFNRRFSPYVIELKKALRDEGPRAIHYRINPGVIPPDHWTQDPDIGGGRIIGELCHFLDLSMYLANSEPVSLSAYTMDSALNLKDSVVVNIKFENGSIAAISYLANGDKRLGKEYIEVYSAGVTAVLDDFKKLKIYSGKKTKVLKVGQDKGHMLEVKQFIEAVKSGDQAPVPFKDIYWSTRMTFDILKSIRNRKMITY